jgi:hypothetical protein
MSLIFSVYNVEDLLRNRSRIDAFKNYVVSFWLLNINDVNNPIIVCYLKREYLLAKLTVHLFELYHDLTFVYFHGALGL